jgi:hypothetical protein
MPSRELLSFLALLLVAPLSYAQRVENGRVEGELTDSVHNRPLAEAMVHAARVAPAQPGVYRLSITDQRGQYHLDSLPPGRYAVSFSHPFLDSLELTMPPREVELIEGGTARLDLAISSGATLRARACPGLQLPPGTGAVVGRVIDADAERPIPGGTVVVGWTDLTVDKATMRAISTERIGAARVDSLGVYRLCGVPTETSLLLQLQLDGRAGSVLQTSVPDDVGITLLSLSFSAKASHALAGANPTARADSANRRDSTTAELTGSASLTGTLSGPAGVPVGDAVVRVVGAAGTARSDSLGRFELGALPAGSQLLEARRIGYLVGRRQVDLRSGRPIDVQLRLERIISLDSIRVIARRVMHRDFEQRKMLGFGHFFTEEQIAQRNAFETSDLLRTIPGFRVIGFGVDTKVVSSRGSISFESAVCEANVVIDGMQHQDINLVRPGDIGAMEIYRGGAQAPPQYGGACGVIVIWTKR